jgi:serine/threonine protein kinase
MTDLRGQSFGRYHILEQLGEGGMALVYKAYDTRLETDVAVKVIRTENILPSVLDRALKRFEREAKALARLTHPNIVKVTDFGEYEGKPYLVMPFLPGGTLKQRMGKAMPWREAIQLLLPISEALDYAHSQGMVHRDVKPSNILLTERGQPMLTDFGIAKMLDLEETQDLTGTSATVGTPEYMAPEQITAKSVDHRADIYALGIVFYEMITGKRPYTADTPMAVLIMHARDPLPNPKKYVPGLPDSVEKILLKTLAKRPEDRYQTMEELAAAFKRILEGKGSRPNTANHLVEKKPVETVAQAPIEEGVPANRASHNTFPPRMIGLLGLVIAVLWGGWLLLPHLNSARPRTVATTVPTFTAQTSPGMLVVPSLTLPSKAADVVRATPTVLPAGTRRLTSTPFPHLSSGPIQLKSQTPLFFDWDCPGNSDRVAEVFALPDDRVEIVTGVPSYCGSYAVRVYKQSENDKLYKGWIHTEYFVSP